MEHTIRDGVVAATPPPVGRAGNSRNGEPGGTRTRDHLIKSQMLYQLSYRPTMRSWRKELLLNHFSSVPHPAPARCAAPLRYR